MVHEFFDIPDDENRFVKIINYEPIVGNGDKLICITATWFYSEYDPELSKDYWVWADNEDEAIELVKGVAKSPRLGAWSI